MSILGIVTTSVLDYASLVPWMYVSAEFSSLATLLSAITAPLSFGVFLIAAGLGGGVGIAGLLSMLHS